MVGKSRRDPCIHPKKRTGSNEGGLIADPVEDLKGLCDPSPVLLPGEINLGSVAQDGRGIYMPHVCHDFWHCPSIAQPDGDSRRTKLMVVNAPLDLGTIRYALDDADQVFVNATLGRGEYQVGILPVVCGFLLHDFLRQPLADRDPSLRFRGFQVVPVLWSRYPHGMTVIDVCVS